MRPRLRMSLTEVADGDTRYAALRIDHLGGEAITPAGWSIRISTPSGHIVYQLPERIARTSWEFVTGETLLVIEGVGADTYLAEPRRRFTYWLYAGTDAIASADKAVEAELFDPSGSVRATTASQGP